MIKGGTVMPPKPVDNPPERRHGGAANEERKAAPQRRKAARERQKGGTVVPPLSSDLLSNPSKTNAVTVITPSVEGTRDHAVITAENRIPMAAGEPDPWQAARGRLNRPPP